MRNNILKIVTVMILLMIVFSCKFVYAASYQSETNDAGGGRTNSPTTSDESSDQKLPGTSLFEPPHADLKTEGKMQEIVSQILGIIELLSQIAIVIAVAIIGFNSVLGSASEKAEWNQKLIGIVIAAGVLVATSKIAQLIINIAEEI